MSIELTRKYLEILWLRYRRTSQKTRRQSIDELNSNKGIHQKGAIRRLRQGMRPKRPGLGRKKHIATSESYSWRDLERFRPIEFKKMRLLICTWILKLGSIPAVVGEVLQRVSAARIDRYLKSFRALEMRRAYSGTRTSSCLFSLVIPSKCLVNITWVRAA